MTKPARRWRNTLSRQVKNSLPYKLAGLLRDAKHSLHFPLRLDWLLSALCCGFCSLGEDCTLILMPPSQREVCLANIVKYLWNCYSVFRVGSLADFSAGMTEQALRTRDRVSALRNNKCDFISRHFSSRAACHFHSSCSFHLPICLVFSCPIFGFMVLSLQFKCCIFF